MEIYIYNSNRELLGIIEAFEYLRWTRKYSRCGSFELKAIANADNILLLQIGNLLWKNDDEEAGIIEILEYSQRETEFITVSGRFLTSLLSRRIIWDDAVLIGDISDCVGQLLADEILNPADTNRKIDGMFFSQESFDVAVNTAIQYKNLMTAICDLCENADLGIRTQFVPYSGVFNIYLYRGAVTQSIFSKEFENVIEQIYIKSIAEYVNVGLVNGQNAMTIVGGGTGIERREIFVDATDLNIADFNDYGAALQFRGNSVLAENSIIQAFDVVVNQFGNLKYKTDFDIGSQITAVSKKWNVSMTARISEVEETYDRDGLSLNLTFGKPLLTLAERLRGKQ
jgi:hypothetical protein